MLVALPSAIAFGVTIFSPLGGTYAAQGAIAGILGVTALGLVAGAFGGTNRLITAPCAPAAAVLAALAIQLSHDGVEAGSVVLMLTLMGLICGLLQVAFGAVGLGRLIKYMPYPVVSGYLSGVGLIIILSQIPKLLGLPKEASLWAGLVSPSSWQWQGVIVGLVTVTVMAAAPRFTKAVPAAILALAAGVLAYFALGLADRRAQLGNDASASAHCRDDKPPLADGEGFVERWLGVKLQGRAGFRSQGFVGVQSARECDGQ